MKLKANCQTCDKTFYYYKCNRDGKYCSNKCCLANKDWRKKNSIAKLGKKMSIESRKKMSIAGKGKKKPIGFGEKISKANKGRPAPWITGEKSAWWKGGITNQYNNIRSSIDYRHWRNKILKRDNKECVLCGSDKNICVDHLIPFASLYMEAKIIKSKDALFDTTLGRVLCKKCHIKTGDYARKTDHQLEARLIVAIKDLFKQENEPEADFELYYRLKMEKLIDHLKGKLE